jgi:PAS domain S-box-containing protein
MRRRTGPPKSDGEGRAKVKSGSSVAKRIGPAEATASILMVDDRPANLLALEAILDPLEQRLVKVDSGEAALKKILEEDFAVILMDVRMPGMDGLRTIELIKQREQSARIPIILLTAVSIDSSDIAGGYALGAVDFILKPLDPEILRSKVSVFVDLYLKELMIKRQAELLRQREREAFERRSEQRFRALMDALPQCVWAARSDKKFYYWNKQATEYSGEPGNEPVSFELLLEQVHPEDRDLAAAEWEAATATETDATCQVRLKRHSDGAFAWFLMRIVPLRESGKLTGWIVAATDIDTQHHALEQAEAANRMKEDFLAIVSHELRNPLNAIKVWTHLLRQGTLDPKKREKAMEAIERNVDLQTSLVEDILDVSSIVRGRMKLTLHPQPLAPIVEAAIAAVKPGAEAKGVELQYECEAPTEIVSADAERLQQVFWNLLSNALKFTPSGGKVTVSVSREGHQAVVMVRDTGQGISPEFLPFAFDRFRQAESPYTRVNGGLGLGLAIARQLVELHGGNITADSEGVDKGATFWILLPVKEKAAKADHEDDHEDEQKVFGRELSVLVVEDQLDSREALAEALESLGARVKTAASVQDALKCLEKETPTLMISDIAMPEADGFELIRKVREHISSEKMPAIAITGLSRLAEQEKALEAGFQVCIVKPASLQRLSDSIMRLTQRT